MFLSATPSSAALTHRITNRNDTNEIGRLSIDHFWIAIGRDIFGDEVCTSSPNSSGVVKNVRPITKDHSLARLRNNNRDLDLCRFFSDWNIAGLLIRDILEHVRILSLCGELLCLELDVLLIRKICSS
jgi:hypothetical protein